MLDAQHYEIGVDVPLVDLIEDDVRELVEDLEIVDELLEEHTICDEEDSGFE